MKCAIHKGSVDGIYEMETVSFSYSVNSEPALNDINLFVAKGEWVTVLGPNGSGKTTLLNLLAAGLLSGPVSSSAMISGEVRIMGQSLSEISGNETIKYMLKDRIGCLVNSYAADIQPQTVLSHVSSRLESKGERPREANRRAEISLELIGISALRYKYLNELSTGERKKAELAMIIALGSEILLLDEPAANMDKSTCGLIASILKDIKSAGKTIVMTSSEPSEFLLHCDKVLLLNADRQIIAEDNPHRILSDYNLMVSAGLLHNHDHLQGLASHTHFHSHKIDGGCHEHEHGLFNP